MDSQYVVGIFFLPVRWVFVLCLKIFRVTKMSKWEETVYREAGYSVICILGGYDSPTVYLSTWKSYFIYNVLLLAFWSRNFYGILCNKSLNQNLSNWTNIWPTSHYIYVFDLKKKQRLVCLGFYKFQKKWNLFRKPTAAFLKNWKLGADL